MQGAHVFSPIDVVDFLAKAPEKREWIIAGKIPRGSTIALIADGGTGKSRLSYDLAFADSWCVAIASGQPWNGFRTTQGKVLIIQTDEPDVDFSDSLRDANYDRFGRGLVQVETEWQFSQIPQLTRWVEQEQPLLVNEATKILGVSDSTLKKLRLTHQLIEGIHWNCFSSRCVRYNVDLLKDWAATRIDSDQHDRGNRPRGYELQRV